MQRSCCASASENTTPFSHGVGCSSLGEDVDIRRVAKVLYYIGPGQFLEDDSDGGDVVHMVIVVLATDGLHRLAELVAVLILDGQVDVGNNDEGEDWLQEADSE